MAAPVAGRHGPTVECVIPWRIVEAIRFELTMAGVDWRRYHPQTVAKARTRREAARADDRLDAELGGWEPRS